MFDYDPFWCDFGDWISLFCLIFSGIAENCFVLFFGCNHLWSLDAFDHLICSWLRGTWIWFESAFSFSLSLFSFFFFRFLLGLFFNFFSCWIGGCHWRLEKNFVKPCNIDLFKWADISLIWNVSTVIICIFYPFDCLEISHLWWFIFAWMFGYWMLELGLDELQYTIFSLWKRQVNRRERSNLLNKIP